MKIDIDRIVVICIIAPDRSIRQALPACNAVGFAEQNRKTTTITAGSNHMKTSTAILLCSLISTTPALVMGTTIANWTFESSVPTTAGPFSPEFGSGTGTAHHSNSSTTYSNPAGNGSAESWGADHWSVGDYWQFSVSTIGFNDVQVAFDEYGSSTGPRDFSLEYSTSGTGFTVLDSYSLSAAGSWYTKTFDLSSIAGLNNDSTVYFRLIDLDAVGINGSSVATTDTDRVDNVIVTGNTIPDSTSSFAGLGCAVALLASLRRVTRFNNLTPRGIA